MLGSVRSSAPDTTRTDVRDARRRFTTSRGAIHDVTRLLRRPRPAAARFAPRIPAHAPARTPQYRRTSCGEPRGAARTLRARTRALRHAAAAPVPDRSEQP
ncbi:hypothetical protein C7S16_6076 [Burkholderia thailandensis]|uniref:Uncharacterized protein n=1 Tax=Burkholderia thailandensis TaxID=57975 RepID=A0AAW9CMI2_BURTH|nr:hypothetical protein [Burkholderia thailandensis]MDW9251865.1 hypothetical protein [Burkholderia thailandensis]